MKTITSRDNPLVKRWRLIAGDPREQRRQCETIIDGPHLVGVYLDRIGTPLHLVVSETGQASMEVQSLLARHAQLSPAGEVICLRDSLFKEISGTQSPVGILAVIAIPQPECTAVPDADCVLLDGVQDAGNVGSILRTAAAAGVRHVVLSPGCAGAWTPRVLRAGQGAHFTLTIHEQVDLVAWLSDYHGDSYAAVVDASSTVYDIAIQRPAAWVFGSEGSGIRAEVLARCKNAVTIPMASTSESLNVAAAAAICIFETRRQKTK